MRCPCLLVVPALAWALPPLPAGDPAFVLPATFEGGAVLLPFFDDLGVDGSFEAFLLSLGLGALPRFRADMAEILATREGERSGIREGMRGRAAAVRHSRSFI